jgi:hypothetical protein
MPVSQTEADPLDATPLPSTATVAELVTAITEASQVKPRTSTESQLRQYMQQSNSAQYGHADAVLHHLNSQQS